MCSSSLAIAAALGLTSHMTKGAVSEFTCTAERYVGVTSGGMDQAISVMGMPGLALLVEFNPVSNSCFHEELTPQESLEPVSQCVTCLKMPLTRSFQALACCGALVDR